ncbi:MAG: N-acetylmuramoyl-L-alanine amidase [Pacificimonas sp.]
MDIIDSPSPNHNKRALPVSIVVMHYTGMTSAEAALERLRDPDAKVSAHYLIAEDGTVMRLVDEDRRAWHAGRAYWRGIRDVNSASIGIELANPGHDHGYLDFPEPQMAALETLLEGILERHDVRPENVIGHSDLAPDRKIDPGEKFPWERFAAKGLAQPRPETGLDPKWSERGVLTGLARFGYETRDPKMAVSAFQRRWRPAQHDGVIDAETREILFALLKGWEPSELRLGTEPPRV